MLPVWINDIIEMFKYTHMFRLLWVMCVAANMVLCIMAYYDANAPS